MKRRDFIKFGAGLGAAGFATQLGMPAARAQAKMVLKASDVHPAGYPTVAAVESLGKKLEAATNGRLSRADVSLDAARRREGDDRAGPDRRHPLARVSVGALGPVVDDLNVLNMPFLFRNTAHMQKVIDGDDRQRTARQGHHNANANLVGLCWMDAGARSFYNTKKPIKTIDDLKGLKVRVIGNPMFVDMANALGANGVAMGYDQVFNALQTGVIDGAENNPPSYVFDNHYHGGEVLHPDRAPDRAGDAGVLQEGLGHDVEGRPGADEEVRARSTGGRARAVGRIRDSRRWTRPRPPASRSSRSPTRSPSRMR